MFKAYFELLYPFLQYILGAFWWLEFDTLDEWQYVTSSFKGLKTIILQ